MEKKQTKWTEYVPTDDYSEELRKAKVRLDHVMKTKNADVYSVWSDDIGWCFVVLLNGTAILMDSEGVAIGRKKKGGRDYKFKERPLIGWVTLYNDGGETKFVVDFNDPNCDRTLYMFNKGFNPVTE